MEFECSAYDYVTVCLARLSDCCTYWWILAPEVILWGKLFQQKSGLIFSWPCLHHISNEFMVFESSLCKQNIDFFNKDSLDQAMTSYTDWRIYTHSIQRCRVSIPLKPVNCSALSVLLPHSYAYWVEWGSYLTVPILRAGATSMRV